MRKRGDRPTLRETQLRTKTHRNVLSWTNRHPPAIVAILPPHDARNISNVTNIKHLRGTDSAATSRVHELDLVANDALNSSQGRYRELCSATISRTIQGLLARSRSSRFTGRTARVALPRQHDTLAHFHNQRSKGA